MSKSKSDGSVIDLLGVCAVVFAVYLGVQHNAELRKAAREVTSRMGERSPGPQRPGTSCLSGEQLHNARVIIAEGRRAGVGAAGQRVAIAAAMTESKMRALPYGDRDSLGIFQQRAAWGSRSARMDPRRSARMFYLGSPHGHPGLTDKANWRGKPLTVAAQSVQQSAYPDRYGQFAHLARRVVANPAKTRCRR